MVSHITGSVARDFEEHGCQRTNFFCEKSSLRSSNGKWIVSIDLTHLPTKQEDIHVKMEQETNTISVTGKAETNKTTPGGMNIFSTHVWSKQTKLPKEVDAKTLSAKMIADALVLTADYRNQEIEIETPNLD